MKNSGPRYFVPLFAFAYLLSTSSHSEACWRMRIHQCCQSSRTCPANFDPCCMPCPISIHSPCIPSNFVYATCSGSPCRWVECPPNQACARITPGLLNQKCFIDCCNPVCCVVPMLCNSDGTWHFACPWEAPTAFLPLTAHHRPCR
jgi:hypothetical protein